MLHESSSDKGKPEHVIRYAGSYPDTCNRLPPVLHITFNKLVCTAKTYLIFSKICIYIKQCKNILKLIPESKGPPTLVKGRPDADGS